MIVEAYHNEGYTVKHENVEEFQVMGGYCDLYFKDDTVSLEIAEYDTIDIQE